MSRLKKEEFDYLVRLEQKKGLTTKEAKEVITERCSKIVDQENKNKRIKINKIMKEKNIIKTKADRHLEFLVGLRQ